MTAAIDMHTVPAHIGIIMDGNGRWAKKRNLPRTFGHKEGLETAKKIVAAAARIGVKYVTLYTFSTENWKRTQEEVGFLMNLIQTHLRGEFEFYKKNGIRIRHLGDVSGLPENISKEILLAESDTEQFTGLTVVLAINYGGRDELIRAFKKFAETRSAKDVTPEALTEFCDIPELPDADLIIRTGGEKRLSNFLMWHSAYAELVFTDTLWPDYTEREFHDAIAEYRSRNRRFGGI
ncbi:polyprenyl diphosphate synthase [Treponema brennaborense]|uniref:Isoprenyl transferase n=1 Tax=Treponema brennaborense (strain DSM 12168 / CIP 105900 / DD5/3) TaxID=906968 RepID=F4LN82_TREBD|nr:polyprenyl diphosphate synthase [Treponema brennaborense]AEE16847.1 Undecaprenyl pyrophosphate synthase [Treponema brennaborense DSM 12168]